MKKKVIFLSIILAFAGLNFVLFQKNEPKIVDISPRVSEVETTTLPTNLPSSEAPSTTSTKGYTFSWLIVRDPEKINLHVNFDEKLSAIDAKSEYVCEHIVNGGFYSEDNKPLGLLVIDGKVISPARESSIFNSYFSIDISQKVSIDKKAPENLRLAVQSGPRLITQSSPEILRIENDEYARRVIVGTTRKREVVFGTIYDKSSPLRGPMLSELPELLDEVQKTTNLKFLDVINLDGGSHSTFISGNTSLSEISRVGTFFCIKP